MPRVTNLLANANPRALRSWVRFPSLSDPRIPVILILVTYVVIGITFLDFNRTPTQVLLMVGAACVFDFILHRVFKPNEPPLFPLSATISGISLCILMNFSHGLWIPLIPVFLAISSKYLFTFNGRHIYNPSLFGVASSLLLFDRVISLAPPQQWGGSLAIVIMIVTAALILFVFKIHRNYLIASFILFYVVEISVKAYFMVAVLPPQTVILGALTSPEFYLFVFFMFTDPRTSPSTPKTQVQAAAAVVLIDSILQLWYIPFSLFLALFTFGTIRLIWMHTRRFIEEQSAALVGLKTWFFRAAIVGGVGLIGVMANRLGVGDQDVTPDFEFVKIDNYSAGIRYHDTPGRILSQVDSRALGLAPWLLSTGDAVAVADVDGNGFQDIFLTNMLKGPKDRVALYVNNGNYQFERVAIPELSAIFADPKRNGVASGALFMDWNNDGAQDLLVLANYGKTRFFQNYLAEEGTLHFVDVTDQMLVDENTTSFAANALDITHNGFLDIVVANLTVPWLTGYREPTAHNLFNLPKPEYPGDRRMLNTMPNSWYDGSNGGGIVIYRFDGGRFVQADERELGFSEHRFSLAVGTGDINNDGWTDLYIANDYGPDQLMLNQGNGTFAEMRGTFVNEVGRDGYRGMNASLADLRNSGNLDIYVSNAHVLLLREGSLLWINEGVRTISDVDRLKERAATMHVSNEEGFGWGAAIGDLDLDGRLDIVQTNGYVSNKYDSPRQPCPESDWGSKAAYALYIMATDVRPDSISHIDNWGDFRGLCLFAEHQNKVYLNRGKYFVNVADKVGWTQPGESRGVALVDLNNSGRLDAIVTNQYEPVGIFRNVLKSPKHWAGLHLEGNGRTCNRDAAGTRVTVHYTVGGKQAQQMREVQIANGFGAQGDRRLLFGLGGYNGDVLAVINWCGQSSQRIQLRVDEYLKVVQP